MICEQINSAILLATLKNLDASLQNVGSGALVHEIANIRSIIVNIIRTIDKKGLDAKLASKADKVIKRGNELLNNNKKEFKHSKNRKYNSTISLFHNMY